MFANHATEIFQTNYKEHNTTIANTPVDQNHLCLSDAACTPFESGERKDEEEARQRKR